MSEVIGDYYDHFEKYFGIPSGRNITPDNIVQVWEYADVFDGCIAYCSLGNSVLFNNSNIEIAIVANAGFGMHSSIILDIIDHAIIGQEPVSNNSLVDGVFDIRVNNNVVDNKSAMLFVDASLLISGLGNTSKNLGSIPSLLWGIYVTQNEFDYGNVVGAVGLLDLLATVNGLHGLFDLRRSSAI